MKRLFYLALASALLMPVASLAQTIDEIIAKNAQARGGIEKLRAMKSLRITARLSQGQFPLL